MVASNKLCLHNCYYTVGVHFDIYDDLQIPTVVPGYIPDISVYVYYGTNRNKYKLDKKTKYTIVNQDDKYICDELSSITIHYFREYQPGHIKSDCINMLGVADDMIDGFIMNEAEMLEAVMVIKNIIYYSPEGRAKVPFLKALNIPDSH